jgi:phosphopantothenoylcysteine decarboxylase/phosphopantothenate--cysteine ligase
VVLNDALEPGAGFDVTTNKVTLLSRSGADVALPLLDKRDVAQRILDAVEHDLS